MTKISTNHEERRKVYPLNEFSLEELGKVPSWGFELTILKSLVIDRKEVENLPSSSKISFFERVGAKIIELI